MANADTGTTGHFVAIKDCAAILDVRVTNAPITVTLPDGSQATSTHIGTLNLPSLPPAARHVDIFPEWIGSLLSIGVLCDCGLTATYTATAVTITDANGATVLSGHRTHPCKLWFVDIHAPPSIHVEHTSTPPALFTGAVVTEAKGTQAQIVAYYHAVMCSPAISSFTHAVSKGWVSLSDLTAEMITRHPPVTTATPKGHMDQYMQGKRSTKAKLPLPTPSDESPDDVYPTTEPRRSSTVTCITKVIPASDLRHTDLTGRFPITSKGGKQYFMIMICANYIHAEMMSSRSAEDYVKAYASGTDFFESHGVTPSYERMDNESSDLLSRYCRERVPRITIQHVPPGNHRGNKAERAIRTFKNHFTAALCD